ncbi:hypothetical protein DPMN_038793 [Dreissena polymorpha]|uniref:Uncharacterized protein n=1 Tax=Dreissena polymorpha TaxID=45954 RepID=A0A9D4MDT1_DREPO|nr:hypothetical protein DPMN_038793 [Dreissena polymorpha]
MTTRHTIIDGTQLEHTILDDYLCGICCALFAHVQCELCDNTPGVLYRQVCPLHKQAGSSRGQSD